MRNKIPKSCVIGRKQLLLGQSRSVDSFNYLLKGMCKSGDCRGMEQMLGQMAGMAIMPDVKTFSILLKAYGKLKKPMEVHNTLKKLVELSVEPNLYLWNGAMDAYGRCGELETSLAIWKYISQQNDRLEIPLGRYAPPEVPDSASLAIALDVCKVGRWRDEAESIWNYSQNNSNIELNANVLTSYLECLNSFGIPGARKAVEICIAAKKGLVVPVRSVPVDEKSLCHLEAILSRDGRLDLLTRVDPNFQDFKIAPVPGLQYTDFGDGF